MTGSPGAFLCRGLKNSAADPGGIVSAEELHAYAAPKTTAYKPSIHPQLKDNYSGDLDLSSLPSPQNLVITNRDNCGENPHLTWDASSGAESYKVYRSTDQHNWQVIATTTNTSYTDCDVIIQKPRTADDQFYYKVTALSSSSESDASRTVTTWGRILEKQITDLDKVTSEQEKLPKEFALLQNYPRQSHNKHLFPVT